MLILGVDTTRDRLVAVLSDENKTYYKVSDEGNKKHTSKLLPVIDELLSENGFTLDDVAAFSAVTGPGSFTGIRVGVSTINALSFAKEKPVIDVTSFELVAYDKGEGVILIDAMHGNYYGAFVVDGNVVETKYFESGDEITGTKYFRNENDDYVLAFSDILQKKARAHDFKESLRPLYLRESQAEREARKNA